MLREVTVRIIFKIILAITITIAILYSVINFYLTKKIGIELKAEIEKASGGEYVLSLGDISINITDRCIQVKNIKLMPVELFKGNKTRKYNLSGNNVKLKNFNVLSYFSSKLIIANKLEFENLTVSIFKSVCDVSDMNILSLNDSLSPFNIVSSKFNYIKINAVRIDNMKINVYNAPAYSATELLSASKQELKINNLNINTDRQASKLVFDNIFNIRLENISYQLENKFRNKRITEKRT